MTASEEPAAWGVIVRRYGMILDRRAVGEEEITIGRDADCDLVLDDPGVSRRAARLGVEDGDLVVRDLGSLAGIKVDGDPVSEHRFRPGDVLEVGPFEIEITGDTELASAAATTLKVDAADITGVSQPQGSSAPVTLSLPDGSTRHLAVGTYTLGRNAECDVQVIGETVSKRHVELRVAYGSVRIVDLDSTNGTSWDGQAVGEKIADQSGRLHLGDELVQVQISQTPPSVKQPVTGSADPESVETLRIQRSALERPDRPLDGSGGAGPAAGDGADGRGPSDDAAPESRARETGAAATADARGGTGAPARQVDDDAGVKATESADEPGGGRGRRLLLLVLLVVAVIVVLLVIVSESSGAAPSSTASPPESPTARPADPGRGPR